MLRALRRCAALLLAAGAVARAGSAESGQDLPMFTATLDALVADERAQGGARGLMAEAGMQLAVLEPPAISPCAGTPMEVVAADGLR